MQGNAVLALWMDIDPALRDECDDWYVRRHIADRIAVPGWRRVRRYQAIEGSRPETLALYEVRDGEDLVSDAYLRLQRNVDTTDILMRAGFSNVARDTFAVRHSAGIGEGGAMLSLRFAPDASMTDEQVLRACRDGVCAELAAMGGVVAVHLLQQAPQFRDIQDGHRKSGGNDARVRWALLVELNGRRRLPSVSGALKEHPGAAGLGWREEGLGAYELMYAVSAR